MRARLDQAEEPTSFRKTSSGVVPVAMPPTTREIPYDYVARFTLEGKRGNRVQDVINISVEGAFVAVAIGYSFIPARLDLRRPSTPSIPIVNSLLAIIQPAPPDERAVLQCLLLRLCGIDFKYNIIDSGTGRELQNQPVHNVAGLGEPSGDRPFRPFAKPMLFMPRSTIRIEVEEISEGPLYGYDDPATGQRIGAELFIVLHGYKVLGHGAGMS